MSYAKIILAWVICSCCLAAANGAACGPWERCGGRYQNGSAYTQCSGCAAGYTCYKKDDWYSGCWNSSSVPPMPPQRSPPPMFRPPSVANCTYGVIAGTTTCAPAPTTLTPPVVAPTPGAGPARTPRAAPTPSALAHSTTISVFWTVAGATVVALRMW